VQMDPQDKLIQDLKAEISILRRENAVLRTTNMEATQGSSSFAGESGREGSPSRGASRGDHARGDMASSGSNVIHGCVPKMGMGAHDLDDGYSVETSSLPRSPMKARSEVAHRSDWGAELYKDPGAYMDMSSSKGNPLARRPSPLRASNSRRPSPAVGRKPRAESAGRNRARRAPTRTKKVSSAPPSKNPRGRGRGMGAKPRRQSEGPPLSDWARSLVADVASGWQEDLKSDEPEWARNLGPGMPKVGGLGSSPRGDPAAFDNWEERSMGNWGALHKETTEKLKNPRRQPQMEAYSSYGLPEPKKKTLDRYAEPWEAPSASKKGGGWNSSTNMSVMEQSTSSMRGSGVTADAAMKGMKRELMIRQLQAQRNRAEKDRDQVMAMARSYLNT